MAQHPTGRRVSGRDQSVVYAYLRWWQGVTGLCIFVIIVLLVVCAKNMRGAVGWVVYVDRQPVCFVRDPQVAERVRQRIVQDAVGGLDCNASIKERWKVEQPKLLSEDEAYEQLKKKTHVVVEAYAIVVDGKPLVYLPSEAAAREALSLVLQHYKTLLEAKGTIVRGPTFRSDVKITQKKVEPSKLKPTAKDALSVLIPAAKRPPVQVTTVVETTELKKVPPSTERIPTASLPAGQTKEVTAGEPGEKKLTVRVTYVNDKPVSRKVIREQELKPPKPRKVMVGTARPAGNTKAPDARQPR